MTCLILKLLGFYIFCVILGFYRLLMCVFIFSQENNLRPVVLSYTSTSHTQAKQEEIFIVKSQKLTTKIPVFFFRNGLYYIVDLPITTTLGFSHHIHLGRSNPQASCILGKLCLLSSTHCLTRLQFRYCYCLS